MEVDSQKISLGLGTSGSQIVVIPAHVGRGDPQVDPANDPSEEGSHNGIAAVLKTADRKVIRVRLSGLPHSTVKFHSASKPRSRRGFFVCIQLNETFNPSLKVNSSHM